MRCDHLGKARLRDRGLGARRFCVVRDLWSRSHRIGGDADRTEPCERKSHQQRLRAILKVHQNPVTRTDTPRGKPSRKARRVSRELP